MIRYYARVSGYVQGVGFRYFVKQTASLYALTGWVRNCENGDVELEAQGPPADMDAFLQALRRGSHYAEVADVVVRPVAPVESEYHFEIADW